jgi:hypothetical protein
MLVIFSFEGLATAALGVYGSTWNETPTMDAIAASGVVMDRFVLSSDQGSKNLVDWFKGDWIDRRGETGPIVLVTDDSDAEELAEEFDEVLFVEHEGEAEIPDEIESTRLGKLILAAIARDGESEDPDQTPSVMWIHSRFLLDAWDAPRNLFPTHAPIVDSWKQKHASQEDADDGLTEDDAIDNDAIDGDVDSNSSDDIHALQSNSIGEGYEGDDFEEESDFDKEDSAIDPIFSTISPPCFQCSPETDDPDLVMSWMRTYGCQVRLIDWMIEVFLASLSDEDPQVMVVSTSGYSLGQNGWVGHRVGTLASPQIQVPLLVSDVGPIRWPKLVGDEMVRAALDDSLPVHVNAAKYCDDQAPRIIETSSDRASQVVTIKDWFYCRMSDGTEHLHWKPDDVDDVNNVVRRRPDVAAELSRR